ncbi:MAG: type II CAAX endopeptidase family protein [Candidatus Bathyarchaeia archaeon]|jgi:membrane protease YdiL (CAAX protease family)
MPEIENTDGSLKTSDEMDQSGVSESVGSNGKRGPRGKKFYVLGLVIVFVAVYSQYLFQYWGVHLGLISGSLLVYGVPVLAITLLLGTATIRRFFKNTYSGLKLGLGLFGAFTVLGIVLAAVILIFLAALDPSTIKLLDNPNPVLQVSPDFAWIMVGVSFLVTGPAEEYIFRGFMFGGLLGIFKNRHWLILAFVSSLLFSATHLYYAFAYGPASLVQFADLVTFGMAMAGTYYFSGGNLFAPALIHGAFDATAFVGVATSTIVGTGLRAFMILLGITVAFLLYIQRGSRRNQIPSNLPQENTRATGFLGGADQI